jgi:hypothetical protein
MNKTAFIDKKAPRTEIGRYDAIFSHSNPSHHGNTSGNLQWQSGRCEQQRDHKIGCVAKQDL